jgi:hypothetical protein
MCSIRKQLYPPLLKPKTTPAGNGPLCSGGRPKESGSVSYFQQKGRWEVLLAHIEIHERTARRLLRLAHDGPKKH